MATKGFRTAGHSPSLAAALIHFDVSFLCWVLVGALGAYIAADLGLSATQKGLMVAVPPLGGAAFRLLLGPLSDRVGIKRLGLITLALTLVPLGWAATLATTFVEVLGVGLLLGVAGASFAVALPLASRWYPPEHQGLALGIAGAGNSGTVVAALAAPRLAERVGWHGTFALAMVPVALAWLAFAALAKEPPRTTGTAPAGGGALSLLRDGDPRWLCGFYCVTFGGFVGLSGYLPIFFLVVPGSFRLGPLVRAVAERLLDRARTVGGLHISGTVVRAGERRVELSDIEARILGALAERPGTVVAKVDLLRDVWGDAGADPHLVEVAVGRLRRRLGPEGRAVAAVPRRGYVLR